jgi:hypothetical protein
VRRPTPKERARLLAIADNGDAPDITDRRCASLRTSALSPATYHRLEGNDLEIDMVILSSIVAYSSIPAHDRRNSSDVAFRAWAPIILIGLAIMSVASGVAPLVDPLVVVAP